MKKMLFVGILIMVIIMAVISNQSYAFNRAGLSTPTRGGINMDAASGFGVSGKIDTTKTQDVFQTIGGVLLYGAIAVAVIWGAILGAKFIVGTVETKATVKDNLVPYFIGLVVAFGAYGIWTAVINVLQ